ncbi:MAG: DUF2252 domain-containing protein [Candidatus Bathyarchaeota archaeon]|nr:DUF2252 domain-containing protein [Candidatus Bathyarchaeota archaeon]
MTKSISMLDEVSGREIRFQQGKALQYKVPFGSHRGWKPSKNRVDPIGLLLEQDKGRIQELLPIKYGRMSKSPFAFLRGSAVIMASDLANTPISGIETMLCGDAHINNFGIFATPERQLVFDVNDFDECYPGPWEWDLKRLVTSVVVAGREKLFRDSDNYKAAKLVVKAYRKTLLEFTKMSTLDMWYYHVNEAKVLKVFNRSKKGAMVADKAFKHARLRTQEQTLEKLTQKVDNGRRFVSDPPLMIPFTEILSSKVVNAVEKRKLTKETVEKVWLEYINSLPKYRRVLLNRFKIVDLALRVVGVGSVGTRCTVMLLRGGTSDNMIILQQKETGPSALERYLPHRKFLSQAQRVVIGQKLMQASNDIFLGWSHNSASTRDYYWRQLKDMKGSIDVSLLNLKSFIIYSMTCAHCLARAHARTSGVAMIAGYLSKGSSFDSAIAEFAADYADQVAKDFDALLDAISSGRIEAQIDV